MYIAKNDPAFNMQLAHLEKQINRNKLQTNQKYRKTYNSIKKSVGRNYNNRVARGRRLIINNAATRIQRHWRGTKTRKPAIVLVKSPNNGNLMLGTSIRAPILRKIHRSKVRRNREALYN
jgi:hypothetical protein